MGMTRLKTARHHWWPQCASRYWRDDDGRTTRLTPNGSVVRSSPSSFGSITGANQIRFSAASEWNEDFEKIYSNVDNKIPDVINWIRRLDRKPRRLLSLYRRRIQSISVTDSQFRDVLEVLVSFVVRSPMIRELVISEVESIRGKLPSRERKNLIAANVRHCQESIMTRLGSRGKFLILFSPQKQEFIFGDGFFNDFVFPCDSFTRTPTKILLPLIPEASVLYVFRDAIYSNGPRLMTLILRPNEMRFLNESVQIYAKSELFYRSKRPKITKYFRERHHLVYRDQNNFIERLIQRMINV